MAISAPALHETRTRITFFLPASKTAEKKAISGVIRYLENQREKRPAVTGFTRSQFPDTVFFGQWWDDEKEKWARESNVLFIVDYDTPLDDPRLERALGRLRKVITRRYETYGSPQQEIWIIAHRAIRYA